MQSANGTFAFDVVPVTINRNLCTGCELCVAACPQQVLRMYRDKTRLSGQIAQVANPDMCTGCAQCEDACPDFCIEVEKAKMEGLTL